MNILFLGTGSFAVPSLTKLLHSKHIVRAVITQPDRKGGRGLKLLQSPIKKLASEHSIPIFQPDDINTIESMEFIRTLEPDLAVTAAFGQIISDRVLHIPKYGFINVHASLLPKYRGAAPIVHTILRQEKVTGVTIFRIVKKLDAGPILAVRMMELPARATAGDVENKLSELGAELLTQVIDNIENGKTVEIPQDDGAASYAPKIDKELCTIKWGATAEEIDALVRALNPRPLAKTRLRTGDRTISISIIETTPHSPLSPLPASTKNHSSGIPINRDNSPLSTPGTIISTTGGVITVACPARNATTLESPINNLEGDTTPAKISNSACGGGAIDIKTLQPENKRPLTAQDFINGRRVKVGDRFKD